MRDRTQAIILILETSEKPLSMITEYQDSFVGINCTDCCRVIFSVHEKQQ